jgi:putative transposase
MREDKIVSFADPVGISPDPLTDVLRKGARALLMQAVEAEVADLLASHAHLTDSANRRRLVRHGHLPEREVMTGIGPVPVKVPRVRDRGDATEKIRFTSALLPPHLRKAKSVEDLLHWLYLKGISTGDFRETLAALLGPDAGGLSSSTIARLKAGW